MARHIDTLSAPLLVSWQLTRDCDLACLHCCTESAPRKPLPDELDADEAMRIADEIIAEQVPYVMLCGGEPLIVPHFFTLAERLGAAGIQLKIETNGQRFDEATAERLARLPIRSIQISLDGDTQETYARQRIHGSLAAAHDACRAVRRAGLPLEITFAPSRLNIHEAEAVVERARALGAFRFNTGALMRIGTAARHWDRLQPSAAEYRAFTAMLERQRFVNEMQLCYGPFTVGDGLRASLEQPPATLLVLPNGWVKVVAALPHICADLRRQSLAEAWRRYREAWWDEDLIGDVRRASDNEGLHAEANSWRPAPLAQVGL